MSHLYDTGLVWLRRDLRVHDHPALTAALHQCRHVHCVFVLDRAILDPLPRYDRRVEFILQALASLDTGLRAQSGKPHAGLIVAQGTSAACISRLVEELGVQAVFCARDYEPDAIKRDHQVRELLGRSGCAFHAVQDHVLVEPEALLNKAGQPYRVFTPYLRAWRTAVTPQSVRPVATPLPQRLAERPPRHVSALPTLAELGFQKTNLDDLGIQGTPQAAQRLLDDFSHRIARYAEARDFPAIKGPSYLSVHVRFGTLSIRQAAAMALESARQGNRGAEIWLSELAWRDFYFQILSHFPYVAQSAFKPEYDAIAWEDGPQAQQRFAAWCEGQTGYPLVDAAMVQLNQTGYMHNRLRMVSGSFLVKHLGIDWRWGERYFAQKLNDFELASNNGGWQWVSSSGCDAQPYFRIFNPVAQSERFDPQGAFIRRYLPQLAQLSAKSIHAPWKLDPAALKNAGIQLGVHYPRPIVDATQARNRTLLRYAVVRKSDQASTGLAQ